MSQVASDIAELTAQAKDLRERAADMLGRGNESGARAVTAKAIELEGLARRMADMQRALVGPRLPGYLRAMIANGDRLLAIEQLELLRVSNPATFAASLAEIRSEAVASAALKSRGRKGAWSTVAKRFKAVELPAPPPAEV